MTLIVEITYVCTSHGFILIFDFDFFQQILSRDAILLSIRHVNLFSIENNYVRTTKNHEKVAEYQVLCLTKGVPS